jgi:DNA mismatch repair protein MutS2
MRRDLRISHREVSNDPEHSRSAFESGDRVRILSYGQDGTVIADNGDTVLVAIGPMKTVVPKTDLQRKGGGGSVTLSVSKGGRARRGQEPEESAKMEAATRTMAELDVRGKRYIEAEPIVDQWIDEAALAGNSPLRLIHGKGTGMLGRGLQEFLRSHPQVKSVRYGDENEGGGGVSIVELR